MSWIKRLLAAVTGADAVTTATEEIARPPAPTEAELKAARCRMIRDAIRGRTRRPWQDGGRR